MLRLRSLAVDYWFDVRHGVDTCSWSELKGLTIDSASKAHGYGYQPTRVMPLRRLFREIHSLIGSNAGLLDIGSGKGRILLVASESGFRKARGVEFARELCEISKRNIARFKQRTATETEFEVIEADAAVYRIRPDETVFILYNPFDDVILRKVLDNISQSVRNHPRKVLVVYYNPKWKQVIENHPDFQSLRDLNFWGFNFNLYSNRDALA